MLPVPGYERLKFSEDWMVNDLNHVILATGGAGFIGSNFVLEWLKHEEDKVINLDKLTYAANLQNLKSAWNQAGHEFVKGDINDRELVRSLLAKYKPRAVVHFAAESHVDRSILGPEVFIQTNVHGTFCLLEESRAYWKELRVDMKNQFRFLHVSTDEVYGSLSPTDPAFTEDTPYAPNSPYSASKAGSDHLVRAYHHTYGLPTLVTNCSNNYGPYQFPEKLIPLVIHKALLEESLPVYGDGRNVRDWLYVTDHCAAIRSVLSRGIPGETYNVGGCSEMENIAVVRTICEILDSLRPSSAGRRDRLIRFVADRPGHDRRYAIDISKIKRELAWQPAESFHTGIQRTVQWYVENQQWVADVTSGAYRDWIETQYTGVGRN
jgi:dTDP-glucose 4,6-dehydratase